MASPIIEFENVSINFGQDVVLEDVNFKIEKGEVVVLIGPSGEGKSVLLKLMAGILEPSKGRVLVEGHDLKSLSDKDREALVKRMGMLFQKNALFDSLTSGENIGFPLREVTDQSEEEIQKKIKQFLEDVAIPHAIDLYPDEISGGMQKRLGIARALALDPEIIFYDDPTAGLDPITSRLIIDLILKLHTERGSTVIAITNDMARAYQMAHRIVMIVDKELIVTGDVSHTKSHSDPRVKQFISGLLEGPLTEAR